MNRSIEQLKTESNEIRSSLESLKQEAQSSEKQKKKQELLDKAKKAKEEAEQLLQQETEASKKTDLQTFQSELNSLFEEISAVQIDQVASQVAPAPDSKGEEKADPNSAPQSAAEKGRWESTKDFTKEQWDHVFSKESWENETGTNLARTAGFIGTGVGAFMLLKKGRDWAFGDDEKEEKKEEKSDSESSSEKKKGFWNSTFGKALKWIGIGTAGAGAIWGIGKLFGRRDEGTDATDSAGNQATETQELKEKDPQKFEKYKTMGANIDAQYNQVMAKELASGRGGMSIADGYKNYVNKEMSLEDYQATVPMCIDNEFTSVANLLSESGHYLYLKEKQFSEIKSEIFQWGEEKIKNILGPFLSTLTSFIPFKGKSRSEALKLWSESGDPSDREAELQLFFRQYVKIVNYTQDKLIKLKYKIAEEKFANVGNEFSSIEEALDDGERVAQYVENDPRFKNFTQGKLHNAIDVMKENQIFDARLSPIMEKHITTADAQRDKILQMKDGKDHFARIDEVKGKVTPELNREAIEACKDIKEDIEDNFDKSWTYLYFSSAHALINTNDKNIQEFLEHSGLKALKGAIVENLSAFQKKFESGSMTEEDLKLYKNQVNSYFAMKKEILIGAEAIQQLKGDNTSRWTRALDIGSALGSDLRTHTKEAYKKIRNGDIGEKFSGWLFATAPLLAGGTAIRLIGKKSEIKTVEKFGRWIQKANIFCVAWEVKGQVVRRMPFKNLNLMPNWLLSSRYNVAHGDQLLFQDIIEGKISGYNAKKIIKKGNSVWETADKTTNSLSEFIQKMAGKSDTELPAKYLEVLFENKVGVSFTRNPSLRKLFFRQEKIGAWDQTKVLRNGYRRKMYVPEGIHHVEMLEKFMNGEVGQTSKFMQLSENQKKMFIALAENGEFTKPEHLKHLMENIESLSLDGIEIAKFNRLAQELSQNLDLFANKTQLSNFVQDTLKKPLKPAAETTVEIAESIRKSNSYKGLAQEFDRDLKILNDDLASATGEAKKVQIQKQINQLENLKKNFALNKTQAEIDQLFDFYKEYSKLVPNKSIANLETLGKMLGKNLPELEDALKKFDTATLKKLKSAGKFNDIDDEAFEGIIKMLDKVKEKKQAGTLLFKNADEMLDGIKSFVKMLSKAT